MGRGSGGPASGLTGSETSPRVMTGSPVHERALAEASERLGDPLLPHGAAKEKIANGVAAQPFPLVFKRCSPGSWVRRHIRLTNVGNIEETLRVSPSNPSILYLYKGEVRLPPGASVFLPVIIRMPQSGVKEYTKEFTSCTIVGASSGRKQSLELREHLAIRGSMCRIHLPVIVKLEPEQQSLNSKRHLRPSMTIRGACWSPHAEGNKQAVGRRSPSSARSASPRCPGKDSSFSPDEDLTCNAEIFSREAPGLPPSAGSASSPKNPAPSSVFPEEEQRHQQQNYISPALLAWQLCLQTPKDSLSWLPVSLPSTASVADEFFHCSSSDSNLLPPRSTCRLLARESSPTESGLTTQFSLETSEELSISITSASQTEKKTLHVRTATEKNGGSQRDSEASRACPEAPELCSEGSITVGAGPQFEGGWKAEEKAHMQGFSKAVFPDAAKIQIAKKSVTSENKVARLKEANQLLKEELQRSREEIAALEMMQRIQKEAQSLDCVQISSELREDPHLRQAALASGGCGRQSRREQQGQEKQQQLQKQQEVQQRGGWLEQQEPQKQEHHGQEHQGQQNPQLEKGQHQRLQQQEVQQQELQRQVMPQQALQQQEKQQQELQQQVQQQAPHEHDRQVLPPAESLYPFTRLQEIEAEICRIAEKEGRNGGIRVLQNELRSTKLELEQQRRETDKREEELRSLRAETAAASVHQEQQRLLLERKLRQAAEHAKKAEAETAAAKEREKHLMLRLEAVHQRLAAAERSAANRLSELYCQLGSASEREKRLKKSLKAVEDSLSFLLLLHRQTVERIEEPSQPLGAQKSMQEAQGTDCLSSPSRGSSTNGEAAYLTQQANERSDQLKLDEEEFLEHIERIRRPFDGSSVPAESAPGVTAAETGGEEGSGTQTLIGTMPRKSPSSAYIEAVSVASSSRSKVSPNYDGKAYHGSRRACSGCDGSCCTSRCCSKLRWQLEDKLCRVTAGLIARTQELAAEEAKVQELQQQAAHSAAAEEAAEAVASAADKKVLRLIAKSAALQAELTAAAAAQKQQEQQQEAAKQAKQLIDRLKLSEQRLRLRCELLTKENDAWKKQLQQQHVMAQQLHQQHLFLLDTEREALLEPTAGQQRPATGAAYKFRRRCCSADTRETTRTRAEATLIADAFATTDSAAATAGSGSGPDPLLCALQQLATGLLQLKGDIIFLRQSREDPSPYPSQNKTMQQKQLKQTRVEALVCQWPEEGKLFTGLSSSDEESPENCLIEGRRDSACKGENSRVSGGGKDCGEVLERRLTDTANDFLQQICDALLSIGLRLKKSIEDEVKSRTENTILQGRLQRQQERVLRLCNEKAVLSAQFNALYTKVAVLEAFTEAEAQRNADHNRQQVTFLQEQLNRSLETLREWTHERPLLVAHQQALSAKVKKLQGALRKVLMSNRQRVMEAKEEAEEEVFQKLSKWRESLVRTTVEATKGRCGSLCHSRGKHHSCSSGELARRHAAAEIAILELTEALSKANLRLACSLNSSINKLSDRKEEVIRKKTEEGPAKPTTDSGIPLGSATIEELEEATDSPDSPCVSQSDEGLKGGMRQKHFKMQSSPIGACCCVCCGESSGRALKQQQLLLATYVNQQQELQTTSGDLNRALAEASHLRDCVKALESQLFALEEAAAKGEGASLQTESLRDRVTHLQACAIQERHVRDREMRLLRRTLEASFRRNLVSQQRQVQEALNAARKEAEAARQQKQQQMVVAHQLQQQVCQLQTEAAEHLQTTDYLLKALSLYGGAQKEENDCGASKADETHMASRGGIPQQLVALLLEVRAINEQQRLQPPRLQNFERDRASALLPSRLLCHLPASRPHSIAQGPHHSEELLQAHRLLLGALIRTQLKSKLSNPSMGMNFKQTPLGMRQQLGRRLAEQGLAFCPLSRACCSHNSGRGSCKIGGAATKQTGVDAASYSSLADSVVSQLLEYHWGVFPAEEGKGSKSCSGCTSLELATPSNVAYKGNQKPGALREAKEMAFNLLKRIRGLGEPLLFVAVVQQRLCDLLTDKTAWLSSFAAPAYTNLTGAADVAGSLEAEATEPIRAPAASEAWLLLRQMQSSAEATAEALKAAHALSICLAESLATEAQGISGGLAVPLSGPQRSADKQRSHETVNGDTTALGEAAIPQVLKLHAKATMNQGHLKSTAAVPRRSKGPHKRQIAVCRDPTSAAEAKVVAGEARASGADARNQRERALVQRQEPPPSIEAMPHKLDVLPPRNAVAANPSLLRRSRRLFLRSIRRCKSCDFRDQIIKPSFGKKFNEATKDGREGYKRPEGTSWMCRSHSTACEDPIERKDPSTYPLREETTSDAYLEPAEQQQQLLVGSMSGISHMTSAVIAGSSAAHREGLQVTCSDAANLGCSQSGLHSASKASHKFETPGRAQVVPIPTETARRQEDPQQQQQRFTTPHQTDGRSYQGPFHSGVDLASVEQPHVQQLHDPAGIRSEPGTQVFGGPPSRRGPPAGLAHQHISNQRLKGGISEPVRTQKVFLGPCWALPTVGQRPQQRLQMIQEQVYAPPRVSISHRGPQLMYSKADGYHNSVSSEAPKRCPSGQTACGGCVMSGVYTRRRAASSAAAPSSDRTKFHMAHTSQYEESLRGLRHNAKVAAAEFDQSFY